MTDVYLVKSIRMFYLFGCCEFHNHGRKYLMCVNSENVSRASSFIPMYSVAILWSTSTDNSTENVLQRI